MAPRDSVNVTALAGVLRVRHIPVRHIRERERGTRAFPGRDDEAGLTVAARVIRCDQ
jgi:hypothetical protein